MNRKLIIPVFAMLLPLSGVGQMAYEPREAVANRSYANGAVPVLVAPQAPVSLKPLTEPTLMQEGERVMQMPEDFPVVLAPGEVLPPEVSVFPNPTQGMATVEVRPHGELSIDLHLFDINGNDLGQVSQPMKIQGPHRFSLDATRLAAGTYIIRAVSGESRFQARFVKL